MLEPRVPTDIPFHVRARRNRSFLGAATQLIAVLAAGRRQNSQARTPTPQSHPQRFSTSRIFIIQ